MIWYTFWVKLTEDLHEFKLTVFLLYIYWNDWDKLYLNLTKLNRVRSGFGSYNHESSWVSGHLGSDRVEYRVVSGFRSFGFGSDQVSGCLISSHLGFRVVRVRVGSDFGHSNLGLSRVSDRLGTGRVGFRSIWLSKNIRSDRVRIRTGRMSF
jgi:hypothetical protein